MCMRRKGDRLRDGPLHGAACRGDGEAFDSAPESAGGVVARQAGVGVDVAGDVHSIGRGAEADHLCVEADGNVEVIFAGEKEDGVALGAELAVLLDGVDGVDLLLHRRG